MSTKRGKGKNFTDRAIALLLDCCEPFYVIIENKKTDGVTSKQKTHAWDEITSHFNSSNEERRTTQQIKNFYDNFKRKTRKDYAQDKLQTSLTGGGSFKNQLSENGKRLQGMLQKQFCPDSNVADCEAAYHEANLPKKSKNAVSASVVYRDLSKIVTDKTKRCEDDAEYSIKEKELTQMLLQQQLKNSELEGKILESKLRQELIREKLLEKESMM